MPKEVERISDEKLDEVTENLLDERQRAGGVDAACIKGVASITDIFVELREARSLIREMQRNRESAEILDRSRFRCIACRYE